MTAVARLPPPPPAARNGRSSPDILEMGVAGFNIIVINVMGYASNDDGLSQLTTDIAKSVDNWSSFDEPSTGR